MRPPKGTCSRLLKVRADLTPEERHDLAEALSRWARTEEHARRVVMALPEHPSALDVRRTAAAVAVPAVQRAPRENCPACFGSGWRMVTGAGGYTGVQPCECASEQRELQPV